MKNKQNKLLVFDPQQQFDPALLQHCDAQGWLVEHATTQQETDKILRDDAFEPHVILAGLPLTTSDMQSFVESVINENEHCEWIFSLPEESTPVTQTLKDIAFEFISPSPELKRFDIIISRALRSSLTTRRLQSFTREDSRRYSLDAYLGTSKAVKELKDLLKSLTNIPLSTLIISGETGTGKGLVARIIHNFGLRSEGPLVELNCAALPKDLLESQLFGHEAGAFTGAAKRHRGLFEQANGGTIFLDEITELDIELQAKLLKAIEDKKLRRLGGEREIEIDAQIFAATGENLTTAVQEGKFREDLYHRLSVFCVNLPPLREHKEDLLELVPRFIAEFNAKANKKVELVPDEIWEALSQHDWPGNVRELRNVVERCVLLSTTETFPSKWLQLSELDIKPESTQMHAENQIDSLTRKELNHNDFLRVPIDGSMSLEEIEQMILSETLQRHDNNVTETARILKTTRETLRYRVQKYNMNLK